MSDTTRTNPDPGGSSPSRDGKQFSIQAHALERLLQDERLRIDTTLGRRPITAFTRDVSRTDRSVDLKRMMSEMSIPDRELQGKMPAGEMIEVTLSQRKMWVLRAIVGRLRVVCVSPTRALLRGDEPKPMTPTEVNKFLASMPPRIGRLR